MYKNKLYIVVKQIDKKLTNKNLLMTSEETIEPLIKIEKIRTCLQVSKKLSKIYCLV